MSRGKRYDGEQKLNIKKVILTVIVFILIIAAIVSLGKLIKYLRNRKDTKNVAKTTITSSILNIVINVVLIKFIGLYAAALSTLISCIFLYMYRLIGVRKYIKLNVEYNFIIISIIVYIISVFLILY